MVIDMTQFTAEKPLRVFLAGHQGMVGRALYRLLSAQAGVDLIVRTRQQLDLTRQADVEQFFHQEKPDWVIIAAAKVGGILANQQLPADFIYQNLLIEANIVHSSWQTGVQRLMLLGSSCIYPKFADQPIREESLLTGLLEPTNEPYAVAKIAGIKLCESYQRQYGVDFRAAMPTNLYGPWDNFHPEHSHVVPGLMRRIHEAHLQQVTAVSVWGSGRARREFLHVDDLACAVCLLMQLSAERYEALTSAQCRHINIGSGEDISIAELAALLAEIIGYQGELRFDPAMPDGTPKKLLAVDKLASLGWAPRNTLRKGLQDTYRWWLSQQQTSG